MLVKQLVRDAAKEIMCESEHGNNINKLTPLGNNPGPNVSFGT